MSPSEPAAVRMSGDAGAAVWCEPEGFELELPMAGGCNRLAIRATGDDFWREPETAEVEALIRWMLADRDEKNWLERYEPLLPAAFRLESAVDCDPFADP